MDSNKFESLVVQLTISRILEELDVVYADLSSDELRLAEFLRKKGLIDFNINGFEITELGKQFLVDYKKLLVETNWLR